MPPVFFMTADHNKMTTVVITVTKPSQLTMFDEEESKRRRDDGIALVADNGAGWHDRAMYVIWHLPIGWTGIGEDIRKLVLESGAGPPHDPNCWGALIMSATRHKMVRRTGEVRHARIVSSNARTCMVLERI
jgi:hypothetical protein